MTLSFAKKSLSKDSVSGYIFYDIKSVKKSVQC